MSIEEEIMKRLLSGYTPAQLIGEGFKKSTVYKVNQEIKVHSAQTTKPEWEITNIYPPELRALPRENKPVNFQFENTSGKDMYLYRIGILTEWMEKDTWVAQEVKDLIKPGQKRFFNFILPVKDGIPLGEYALSFGVELQYLPAVEHQPLQTLWTEPMVFHVKQPRRGICVFFSHSVNDLTLIRQLETQLDNYGITVIIGEDKEAPGTELRAKFANLIQSSTIFIALLTSDSINSPWVQYEINYAKQIRKPMLLLKEDNLRIEGNNGWMASYEWISFSKYAQPELILQKIMKGINYIQGNSSSLAPLIGLGLLALILGIAASGEK